MGTRQTGLAEFKIAELGRDDDLLDDVSDSHLGWAANRGSELGKHRAQTSESNSSQKLKDKIVRLKSLQGRYDKSPLLPHQQP